MGRPDPLYNTDAYDVLRRDNGDERLAKLLWLHWNPKDLLIFDKAETEHVVEKMLERKRAHAEGCLGSRKPDMTVSRATTEAGDGTSELAKALYFRRCDGVYKNIASQRLSICS